MNICRMQVGFWDCFPTALLAVQSSRLLHKKEKSRSSQSTRKCYFSSVPCGCEAWRRLLEDECRVCEKNIRTNAQGTAEELGICSRMNLTPSVPSDPAVLSHTETSHTSIIWTRGFVFGVFTLQSEETRASGFALYTSVRIDGSSRNLALCKHVAQCNCGSSAGAMADISLEGTCSSAGIQIVAHCTLAEEGALHTRQNSKPPPSGDI
jgi:hypothetical protein